MSNEIEELRKEFQAYKKITDKKLSDQAKEISKLEKAIEAKKTDIIKYVNNLMRKADNLMTGLRKTQVIDRQRLNDIDRDVDFLRRKK